MRAFDFSAFAVPHWQYAPAPFYTTSPFTHALKSILFSKPVLSSSTFCNGIIFVLYDSMIATSYMWLLSICNIASVTEELNLFYFKSK